MIEQGQWFKGKDFELHYVEDKWIITLKRGDVKQVFPLELMVTVHGIIQDNYLNKPYYENRVDIDVVINWMNEWEQLKGTVIPIRFKEDFHPVAYKAKPKWYQFWK